MVIDSEGHGERKKQKLERRCMHIEEESTNVDLSREDTHSTSK